MNDEKSSLHSKQKSGTLFLETLKECGSKTTCHAIPYIAATHSHIIRIFWTLLFLAALGGGAYC